LTVDVTSAVIDECREKGCDCTVSHHPLFFKPAQKFLWNRGEARLLAELARHDIALIAMHTNADAASSGINYRLAKTLGLKEIEPLQPLAGSGETLTGWIDAADAHRIQNLSGTPGYACLCDTTADGKLARFELSGSMDTAEMLKEISKDAGISISGARVVACREALPKHGMGAIGRLPAPIKGPTFREMVKHALGTPSLRSTAPERPGLISTVAVCGGAGAQLVPTAIARGADAMVTADLTYHAFHDYRDSILLIDAGHYETERVFLEACASYILDRCRNTGVTAHPSTVVTNPVFYA
jgi:dinuclear metal center YbgI/SA1388 family protein